MNKYLSIAVLSIILTSCGGEPKEKAQEETTKIEEKVCTYSYNNESTEVRWTAYKHTSKTPVGGQFDSFETVAGNTSVSAMELLTSLEMTVDVPTINSKDTARDKKLLAFFFDIMANTGTIVGKVKSATETTGVITMKMNDVEQDVDFEYSVGEDNKLELKATIDVLNFQGDDALASLGKACEAKHTGGDGEVKLWSEVALYITTQLEKTCE
ncbi:MAG: YceI family protein [Flavobacteriales bacterium]|nr:YceI family protein [Flavobacteriales bacterium]